MKSQSAKIEVIHFIAENVHFCVELEHVDKVIPLTKVDPYPNAPTYLAGFLNLAGASIPIIDLALRVGLPRHSIYSLDLPILICINQQKRLGIIVDKIIGLAKAELSELQQQDLDQDSVFLGLVPINTQLTWLLNLNVLFKLSRVGDADKAINVNSTFIEKPTVKP